MRSLIGYPRIIKPELVEIGDDIEVTFPANDGLTMSIRGKVAKRQDHGAVRYLLTEEGGTILAWEASRAGVRVIIYGRAPVANETLFETENLVDVKERINEASQAV